MWHVSVSAWSAAGRKVREPLLCERTAIGEVAGVGNQREWWWWNPDVHIGHLRVGLTNEEYDMLPAGVAVSDAGESGPERNRRRLR